MWMGATECLAHWGIFDPDRPAALLDGTFFSYGAIAGAAASFSAELVKQGLSGQRVAIVSADKLNFMKALFGAQLARCPTIVAHPKWSSVDINRVIVDTQPSAFIVDPGNSSISGVAADKPSLSPPLNGDRQLLRRMVQSHTSCGAPEDEWGIVYSSGSTGQPKPIVQTQYSTMTECVAWCMELGLRKSSSFYIARPLYYTGGMALALATMMTRGLLIADNYADDNDASELLHKLDKAASRNEIDHCFLVPELGRAILALRSQWSHRGNPKSVLLMGSKIHAEEKHALADFFGCSVVESWGNSEGLGTITDPADLDVRPGSIGRPFLTEGLWIVDDALDEVPADKIGRIAGSDETMFKEYANHPGATQQTKRADLVVSDDIGYRDRDGYFYILGRVEDVLTVGDNVVTMPAIENDLRGMEGIKDAYVGSSDASPLRLIVVIETTGAPVSEDRIRADIERTVETRVGTQIAIGLSFVDTLPKLSSGKIDRIAARALGAREHRG
jgi:acyl-coenzyme A synthetase/AMP-(fatty) acid ligase